MIIPVVQESGSVSDDARRRLGEFLAVGSLYGTLDIEGTWMFGNGVEHVIPLEIQRSCDSTKCKAFESAWKLGNLDQNPVPGTCAGAIYHCRNCETAFYVWFRWDFTPFSSKAKTTINDVERVLGGTVVLAGDRGPSPGTYHFEKIGQHPAPTVKVPYDLIEALGSHADLYRKALICRNQGFGIGSLAYFRRVLEETMNEMLTLLAAALEEEGADVKTLERVKSAKSGQVFEHKVKVAADALPGRLRPGGFNPFGSLHSLYSGGVHERTDQECLEIVDQMREEMDIIFKTLKTHVAEQRGYKEAAIKFQSKRTPQK